MKTSRTSDNQDNGRKTKPQPEPPFTLSPPNQAVEHILHTLPDSIAARMEVLESALHMLPPNSPLFQKVRNVFEPLLRHAIAAEHFEA